ncbi:MAG: polyprenyl diphosphate synthase [Nanoarchaeota archaeon]
MKPTLNEVPKHIGLILDGNRRLAKRLMLKPYKGHEWGAKKVHALFDWCKELGVREITLYCFSCENFDRPKKEFAYLMNLFKKEFEKLKIDQRVHNDRLKLNFIGRLYMFPQDIQERMQYLMNMTKNYNDYIINFAMAYGGRQEVIDATRKIAQQIKEGKLDIDQINEETFSNNLYMKDEPDLVIRTGESRLSGFLLWQSNYSEIIFLPNVLWPEFSKEHFISCIEEYKNRDRRFGK